ncbi:hypothetical protein [Bordetella genomosp. 4]|uniref:Lipoprotein n=1 Tax=Bordetella genomosp. 4 TaxID=463044 RepID=A0A261V119_9BORD|nr:hypothetical protein [Bordetella genomosp. 4]OZI54138.1 hypothetical protein CAL21_00760 [Bordetella genomosp. 4]OZI67848.1 hypothetical protein CAL20_02100 [Bordetella genomosp. 4]
MSARFAFAVISALVLSACTEAPQEMHPNAGHGAPEYAGTGSNFVAPGWKQGDKTSWTSEMTARTQRGQNEYNKLN